MNKSKDLRALFRQSLINERTRPKTTPTYGGYSGGNPMYMGGVHRTPCQCERDIQFCNEIKIYFYEWSDVTKAPRCFYQLDAFENFLKASGIYMELYQRDIIKNLGCVYITCYTSTKNLNIRASYKNLLDSMREYGVKKLADTVKSPVAAFGSYNRWVENDGTFFG